MKKLLVLVAAVSGVLTLQKKLKAQKAEQELWAEATDQPGTAR
jgi:hypothetical protein